MKFDPSRIGVELVRYRKPILISLIGILTTIALGIGALGYLTYQAGIFAKDKVATIQNSVGQAVTKVEIGQGGVVEGVMVNLASAWVQQNLASAETAQFMTGLSCFDALGGPSPTAIINHLKAKTEDTLLLTKLEDLSTRLENIAPQANGSAACANWILSG